MMVEVLRSCEMFTMNYGKPKRLLPLHHAFPSIQQQQSEYQHQPGANSPSASLLGKRAWNQRSPSYGNQRSPNYGSRDGGSDTEDHIQSTLTTQLQQKHQMLEARLKEQEAALTSVRDQLKLQKQLEGNTVYKILTAMLYKQEAKRQAQAKVLVSLKEEFKKQQELKQQRQIPCSPVKHELRRTLSEKLPSFTCSRPPEEPTANRKQTSRASDKASRSPAVANSVTANKVVTSPAATTSSSQCSASSPSPSPPSAPLHSPHPHFSTLSPSPHITTIVSPSTFSTPPPSTSSTTSSSPSPIRSPSLSYRVPMENYDAQYTTAYDSQQNNHLETAFSLCADVQTKTVDRHNQTINPKGHKALFTSENLLMIDATNSLPDNNGVGFIPNGTEDNTMNVYHNRFITKKSSTDITYMPHPADVLTVRGSRVVKGIGGLMVNESMHRNCDSVVSRPHPPATSTYHPVSFPSQPDLGLSSSNYGLENMTATLPPVDLSGSSDLVLADMMSGFDPEDLGQYMGPVSASTGSFTSNESISSSQPSVLFPSNPVNYHTNCRPPYSTTSLSNHSANRLDPTHQIISSYFNPGPGSNGKSRHQSGGFEQATFVPAAENGNRRPQINPAHPHQHLTHTNKSYPWM